MQTDPQPSPHKPAPLPRPTTLGGVLGAVPATGVDAPARRAAHELYPSTPPRTSVEARAGAEVDAGCVRVLQEGAVKYNTFPSRAGYPSGMASLRTHLHVELWVKNTTYAKDAWADVHVYVHDGSLAHSETLALRYARPAGDGGDVFVLDSALYQGSAATPGSVDLRPDARVIQYRAYCRLDGRTVTDGELHACYLKPDIASA